MKALRLTASWEPKEEYIPSEREIKDKMAYRCNMVWKNPEVKIQEVPKPSMKEPDEVLIRVKACGVCGTDVHFTMRDEDNYMIYPGNGRWPATIGHEIAGQIEETGNGIQRLKCGDMVAVEEMNWCGRCTPCRMGMLNQCENLEEIGVTIDGGMAPYLVTKEKYCWKLDSLRSSYGSEDKVYEAGALVEPTSVAYNNMFIAAGGFQPGAHVVVFGAGPIGLAGIGLAKAAGAARIIAFETSSLRIELAKKMGADFVFNPLELEKKGTSPHERILDITDKFGASMLVEAAGHPKVIIPEMEKAMAINGKVIIIAMLEGKAPIDITEYQKKASHLHGAMGHSGNGIFPSVINLMACGRLDMTQIITGRYPLEQALDGIAKAGIGKEGKVLIKPQG